MSKTSKTMLAFLKRRVEANQGIMISLLPGHLSQLPAEVRASCGANEPAIRKFMEKHPEVFVIDNTGRVFTRPEEKISPTAAQEPCAEDDITALFDAHGKVLRIFNVFGFISVAHPVKTTVYFSVKEFEKGKYGSLLDCGLAEGDSVVFDATKSVGHKAAFKATCVSRIHSKADCSASKSQPAEEQPEDEEDRLNDQRGIIHSVKPGYGFIIFGPKKKNCAFFHGSVVDKAVARNSRNLTEFLTVGDKVHFDARPDDKPSKWVKWKATKVWRVPTPVNSACNSDVDSGDEVFMSEDENEIQDLLNGDSEQESSDVDVEDYPVGRPDWEDPPRRPHQGDEPCGAKALLDWTSRTKLSGMKGFFMPQTEKTGLVLQLDTAVSIHVVITTVYQMGRQIKSFSELGQDSSKHGVEVFFDAVEDDDMWVATLVWTGERPAKLHVNHSEHIFNSVLALVKVEALSCERSDRAVARPLSGQSGEEPAITIFPNGKGIVTEVLSDTAVANVQEPDGVRQLKFVCFYKDGSGHNGHLNKVLQTGDVVSVDYMVGTFCGKDYVHCGLVWQGRKPSDAAQLCPEDFMKQIRTRPAQRSACSSANGQMSSSPAAVSPKKQENDMLLPSDKPYLDPLLPGVQATGVTMPMESGVRSLNEPIVQSKKKHGVARASSAEPSVTVYSNAKGTITQVLDCLSTVLVKEADTTRKIEFSVDCFYRDGAIVITDDLNEVLGIGDKVSLDYMVGDTGRKEVVFCDLVWQGKRPCNVQCLSPEDFAKELDITQPSAGVTVSVDDLCSGWKEESLPGDTVAAPEQQRPVGEDSMPELGMNMPLPKLSPKQATKNIEQPPVLAESINSPRPVVSGIDDEALLRLIRAVVEEYQAKLQEELQKCVRACMEHPKVILVHSAATQTYTEDAAKASSSCGDKTPPFFSPCGSPSRELDPPHMSSLAADSTVLQLQRFAPFQPFEAPSAAPGVNASLHPDDASDLPAVNGTSEGTALMQSESALHLVKTSGTADIISEPAGDFDMQAVDTKNVATDVVPQAMDSLPRPCVEVKVSPSLEQVNSESTCVKAFQSELATNDAAAVQSADSYVPLKSSNVSELSVTPRTEGNCDGSDEHCRDEDTMQPSEALHVPDCEFVPISGNFVLGAERTLNGLSQAADKAPAGESVISQPTELESLLVQNATCSQPPRALDAPCGGIGIHLVEELVTAQADEVRSRVQNNGAAESSKTVLASDCHIAPPSEDAVFEVEKTLNELSIKNTLPDALVNESALPLVAPENSVAEDCSTCSQPGAGTSEDTSQPGAGTLEDTMCGGASTHRCGALGAVHADEGPVEPLDTALAPEGCNLHTANLTQDSKTALSSNSGSGSLNVMEVPLSQEKAPVASGAPESVPVCLAPSEMQETAEQPVGDMSP